MCNVSGKLRRSSIAYARILFEQKIPPFRYEDRKLNVRIIPFTVADIKHHLHTLTHAASHIKNK